MLTLPSLFPLSFPGYAGGQGRGLVGTQLILGPVSLGLCRELSLSLSWTQLSRAMAEKKQDQELGELHEPRKLWSLANPCQKSVPTPSTWHFPGPRHRWSTPSRGYSEVPAGCSLRASYSFPECSLMLDPFSADSKHKR